MTAKHNAISSGLIELPALLRLIVQRHWEAFTENAATLGLVLPTDTALFQSLSGVWGASEFVAFSCVRDPQLLIDLVKSGDLRLPYPAGQYSSYVKRALAQVTSEQDLVVALRRLRCREMVRIAWRDLAGWADLHETLADLTQLAEACVDGALSHLDTWHNKRWGTPCNRKGDPQSLTILGMGKLGAGELNFSSDIDLMFAFPDQGETNGPRPLSADEYFTRLGRTLIKVLSVPTPEGFVFRVDMRLRPFGDNGPLVMSFAAMEDYYQVHGQAWERYALIKARPVAGDRAAGEQLLKRLQPFVYRRYLDYGAYESLREMKQMIAHEVQRKGLTNHIKLGPGGIREVEFIGQAFQLIRGGREPALRARAILDVLERLAELGHLPAYASRELSDAYIFLRRVENYLQAEDDRQTHCLPVQALGQTRLAFAMGYPSWEMFSEALDKHRRRVRDHFDRIFGAPKAITKRAHTQGVSALEAVWLGTLEGAHAEKALVAAGYSDASGVLRVIERLRDGAALRERRSYWIDRLMPLLLAACAGAERPNDTLPRLADLIEAIARRTAYLALLVEHPLALAQLVKLCAASPWIAGLLKRYPVLLDELLDPRRLYAPLNRSGLERELNERLAHIPANDLEQQMEALREFKQTNTLRVAAADVASRMPLMVVSDHLTEIAEVILGEVLNLAWQQVVERYGEPCAETEDREVRVPGFAIVAYGKLGGIELGYGADLDLVFLHDSTGAKQHTRGPKSVENAVFFGRLGQRIIHILNTQTPAGVLYEVDVRLRPSGNAGLLVSSVDAFADYQRTKAWTWEHQALVRARVVVGSKAIAARFETIRREVLCAERDPAALRAEVRDMRNRMRAELAPCKAGYFDLKQARGGIADIEFLVQYNILLWAHRHPELVRHTDNIRQLEALAEICLISTRDAAVLAEAYRAYRARMHRLRLNNQPGLASDSEFETYRLEVAWIWHDFMED
jgi:Glutamine synthetase adenylyltransferase